MKNSMGELASFTTRAGGVYGGFAISVITSLLTGGVSPMFVDQLVGQLDVLTEGGVTTFDLGGWKSRVASRKNDDGTISFITIDPGTDGFEFVVGEREGRRGLVIRDG
jgi:hypothetical protein